MNEQSPWVSRLTTGGIYFGLLILVAQLRDRNFEFVLEPDFWSPMITAWRLSIETLTFGNLPVPSPHPYMDGQFIVYALGASALRGIASIVPSLQAAFPNVDSYNLGAANLINAVAFAGAGTILFRTIASVTDNIFMGIVAALLLVTAPSMITIIGFVRCDYLSMLPIVALFCGGLQIARGKETATISALLGLALALIVTIKITGCFFALFLIVGVAARWISRPTLPFISRQHFAVFSLCFAVALMIFMLRYWIYLSPIGIAENFLLSVERVAEWTKIPSPFPFYYYHLILPGTDGGAIFILLYVASSAMICRDAIIKRDPISVYLTISFVAFSIIAMLGYKYARGGYHLLPIFIANIAVAVARLQSLDRKIFISAITMTTLALGIQAICFVDTAISATQRAIAIDATRRAPRLWLKANTSKDDTICIERDSDWAVPLGDFKVVNGPFNFPYLDSVAMAKFFPPSIAETEKACRVVVLNDFHEHLFNKAFDRISLAQGDRWRAFYDDLRKSHPPHIFSSNEATYGIKRVEIFDMKNSTGGN